MTTTAEELQAQADSYVWFHTIDLGQGVVTKGLGAHWHSPQDLPDFSGHSVLDIGAWDGYYSFLAERGGASKIVALDNYAWGVDFEHAMLTGTSARQPGPCPTIRET